MAERTEDVVLRARLRDELTKGLEKIRRDVRATILALEELDGVSLGHIKHEVDELAISEAVAAREAKNLKRSVSDLGKGGDDLKALNKSMKPLAQDMDAADKKGSLLTKTMKAADKVFGSLSKGLLVFHPKMLLITSGVGILAQTLTAAGGGALALVGGLAPLAGLVPGLAGGMLAFASATGAVKLGLHGVGAAASAILNGGSAAQMKAVLQNLGPQALVFAKNLAIAEKTGVQPLQQAIGRSLIPGLNSLLKSGMRLEPVFAKGLGHVGAAVGGVAARFGKNLSSGENRQSLNTVFKEQATFIAKAGNGAISLTSAFLRILAAAAPLTTWIGSLIEKFGKWADTATRAGKASGGLAAFFTKTQQVASNLGHIIVDVGKGLYNIAKIGAQVFFGPQGLGSGFKNTAKSFDAWTTSAGGIAKITAFFQGAKPILHSIAGIFTELAVGLGGMGNQGGTLAFFEAIRTKLVPALISLVTAMTGPNGFLTGLVSIGTAFAKFNAAIPYSTLGFLAKIIGTIASGFSALPHSIQTGIGGFLLLNGVLALTTKALIGAKLGVFGIVNRLADSSGTVGAFGVGMQKSMRVAVGAVGGLISVLGSYQAGQQGNGGGTLMGILGAAGSGALIGSTFGGLGTAIGGLAGAAVAATASIVGSFNQQKTAIESTTLKLKDLTDAYSGVFGTKDLKSQLASTITSKLSSAQISAFNTEDVNVKDIVNAYLSGNRTKVGSLDLSAPAVGSATDPKNIALGALSDIFNQIQLQLNAYAQNQTFSGTTPTAKSLGVTPKTLLSAQANPPILVNGQLLTNNGKPLTIPLPGIAGLREFGGPVGSGLTYLVGERRPEVYFSDGGAQLVGAHGPELRTFPNDGYIMPNAADLRMQTGKAVVDDEKMDKSYFDFRGRDTGSMTEADIRRATKQGIAAQRREDAERRRR